MNALYGIDVGKVYRDAESIKSARINNQVNNFNLKTAQSEQEQKEKLRGLRKQVVMRGDDGKQAMLDIAAIDLSEASDLVDFLDKQDKRGLADIQAQHKATGNMIYAVMQSPDKERAIQQAYSMMPEETASKLEQERQAIISRGGTTEDFLTLKMARLMERDELVKHYTAGHKVLEFGDQALLEKNGQVVDQTKSGAQLGREVTERNNKRTTSTSRANALTAAETSRENNVRTTDTSRDNALLSAETSRENNKRTTETSTNNALLKSQGGDSGMKAADENAMYRQSVELLGGLFDAQGNIQGLDPSIRSKVQAIATEATRIYKSGGVSRTEAVSKAADKYGVNIPQSGGNAAGADNNDPLGLFK